MNRTKEVPGRIVCKNVTSGYRKKTILKDVSLTFLPGKTTVILGENGSGKTTLLKTMAGLLPYNGSITIDGAEIKDLSYKQRAARISLLSQMNSMYFSYTVRQTVLLARYRFHKGFFVQETEEDRKAAAQAMEKFDIYDIREERTSELSGGQLQRVYLAQLFAQDADCLFLDEPTNHLDMRYRVLLEREIRETDKTVIAVYHDLRDAVKVADELVLIKNGCVLEAGPQEQILRSENLNVTFDMDVVL